MNAAKESRLPELTGGLSWQVLHYQDDAKPGIMMECVVAIVPVIISVAMLLMHNPLATHSPVLFFAFLFVLSVLSGLGAVTFAAARPPDLLVSYTGILAPAKFLMSMHLRPLRAWSDVKRVSFLRDSLPSDNPDTMRISFRSGGTLELELKSMKHSDLKQLLIALQTHVPGLATTPELSQVTLKIPDLLVGDQISSFTQQWEDELSERFAATLFVPLKTGDLLAGGKYKIRGHLTFGGSSAVYLANNAEGEKVIIKEAVLPRGVDKADGEKAIEMFEREARLLMKLNSPRIARLLDMLVENEHHYLVLEYLTGTDLRSFVKEQGAQPEEFVLRWGMELAGILTYLHERHPPVIHRDISPDNIVVRIDGSLALIDFGAANEFLGTATGTIVGKQAYIAPEQFQGKATPQSDIYGLGATLYFLACGQDPPALSTASPREVNSGLSKEFDRLVANCTDMHLNGRFHTAEQVKEAIQEQLR